MRATSKTVDFGAPDRSGAHVFRVEIPEGRSSLVIVAEDYGHHGEMGGVPASEDRVHLTRLVWSAIAEAARHEFNGRLQAAKLPTARWRTGTNRVDRLLGKELCVLAWAAEGAPEQLWPVVCAKWAALRPEERWWLYSMTSAEAGLPEDKGRGWRKALAEALSDGSAPAERRKKRPRPVEPDMQNLSLFSLPEGDSEPGLALFPEESRS